MKYALKVFLLTTIIFIGLLFAGVIFSGQHACLPSIQDNGPGTVGCFYSE